MFDPRVCERDAGGLTRFPTGASLRRCLGARPPPLWAPDVSGTPLTVKAARAPRARARRAPLASVSARPFYGSLRARSARIRKLRPPEVLSYNLFWWNLYGKRGGNGDSASNLIASAMQPEPFDFMGFQEIERTRPVLTMTKNPQSARS